MLLLIKKIQRIADFEDSYEVNLDLKLIGYDEIIEQAKELDKEDYMENCFGVDFTYIKDENRLCILNVPNSIYYVDNNGEKNYFEVSDIVVNNIERVLFVEMQKFNKDKEKYLKNNDICYDKVV